MTTVHTIVNYLYIFEKFDIINEITSKNNDTVSHIWYVFYHQNILNYKNMENKKLTLIFCNDWAIPQSFVQHLKVSLLDVAEQLKFLLH